MSRGDPPAAGHAPRDGPDNLEIYDGNWAEWTDMKLHGPASRWLRALTAQVVRPLRLASPARVLDVGCGDGTNTWFLARELAPAAVTGVDFSSAGIEAARRHWRAPNLEFRHDPRSEALASRWDLVTCFEVLEHVEDWRSLLGRIADASGRWVLLSFPTGRMRPYEVHVGHLRNFRRGEVEPFLAGRGFAPVDVRYAGFPFFSPLYREVCNLTDAGSSGFTRGRYGLPQKTVAAVLYALFRFGSTRRRLGDQFVGLFERTPAPR